MQAVGPLARRRTLIQEQDEPSIRRQCELLEISRTAYYYQPCPETQENLELMRRLDELHLEHPVYGSRRLAVLLQRQGCAVSRGRSGNWYQTRVGGGAGEESWGEDGSSAKALPGECAEAIGCCAVNTPSAWLPVSEKDDQRGTNERLGERFCG